MHVEKIIYVLVIGFKILFEKFSVHKKSIDKWFCDQNMAQKVGSFWV